MPPSRAQRRGRGLAAAARSRRHSRPAGSRAARSAWRWPRRPWRRSCRSKGWPSCSPAVARRSSSAESGPSAASVVRLDVDAGCGEAVAPRGRRRAARPQRVAHAGLEPRRIEPAEAAGDVRAATVSSASCRPSGVARRRSRSTAAGERLTDERGEAGEIARRRPRACRWRAARPAPPRSHRRAGSRAPRAARSASERIWSRKRVARRERRDRPRRARPRAGPHPRGAASSPAALAARSTRANSWPATARRRAGQVELQVGRGHGAAEGRGELDAAGDRAADRARQRRQVGHGEAQAAAQRLVGEAEPRVGLEAERGTGDVEEARDRRSRRGGPSRRPGWSGVGPTSGSRSSGRRRPWPPPSSVDLDRLRTGGDVDIGAEAEGAADLARHRVRGEGGHHRGEVGQAQVDAAAALEAGAVDLARRGQGRPAASAARAARSRPGRSAGRLPARSRSSRPPGPSSRPSSARPCTRAAAVARRAGSPSPRGARKATSTVAASSRKAAFAAAIAAAVEGEAQLAAGSPGRRP